MLRTQLNLTLRDLEVQTSISNSALSLIENGKQPMREIHVLKLTSFFDVTSDYLLGYSSTGIGVNFEDDHDYISVAEWEKLKERYETKETILKVTPNEMVIKLPSDTRRIYRGEYVVFREVNTEKGNAGIETSLKDKIVKELDMLDSYDLEKVLKFIKEYIR